MLELIGDEEKDDDEKEEEREWVPPLSDSKQ
jgi:hypothetical protein